MKEIFTQARSTKIHPAIVLARTKVYNAQLTEDDVVALCDLFLTPGVHAVTFSSLTAGRRVIDSFMEQLTCYRAVGYIDKSGPRAVRGMNLYELFAHCDSDTSLRARLEQFFLEEFYYDFIWIIYPKYQVARTFIQVFLDYVFEFHIDRRVPVVFVST